MCRGRLPELAATDEGRDEKVRSVVGQLGTEGAQPEPIRVHDDRHQQQPGNDPKRQAFARWCRVGHGAQYTEQPYGTTASPASRPGDASFAYTRSVVTSARASLALSGAVVTLIFFGSLALQSRIDVNGGRGWDGQYYGAIADAFLEGRTPIAPGPYVYRIGTPVLAASAARWSRLPIETAFLIVNGVAAILASLLLHQFLRQFVAPLYAFVCVCLF